ncbi:LysR substrate-binding domain-containing protein [Lentzea sp. CC55]|uniref:LysR substrate-binding domain-containing protein n=1 Tax=Lentzea sp. CC55 TaxID=2884909 RepID=UPI0027DFC6D6|nr:LysR substrate-binding domain-containing protein [Lentzea sp. CC55]
MSPAHHLDLATLSRTFTIRSSDGFVEAFGPRLVAQVGVVAPGVRLRFLRKASKGTAPLRDTVDLDTAVVEDPLPPDVLAAPLFCDTFVGVVRPEHPLADGPVTIDRYTAARHVNVSRRGLTEGLVDQALHPGGAHRDVVTVVDGFAAAVALAGGSDLVATVPDRHTAPLRDGLHTFALPFPPPQVTISLLWHTRLHADPAHHWLRTMIQDVCNEAGPPGYESRL